MTSSTVLHYKDNETFLRYLAMSYVGETAAISLMLPHGHQFQFHGDGAGSYELFTEVARKKKRTPDLRCALCGQKLEVRSKSSVRIAMSDSPSRPFDRELAQDDWVGFVQVKPSTNPLVTDPLDPAHYSASDKIYVIKVAELSATKSKAVRPPVKSADKGSESYLEWPSLLARRSGHIRRVGRDPNFVEIETANGTLERWAPPPGSYPYNGIRVGDPVVAWSTLVTGVARTVPSRELACKAIKRVPDSCD